MQVETKILTDKETTYNLCHMIIGEDCRDNFSS